MLLLIHLHFPVAKMSFYLYGVGAGNFEKWIFSNKTDAISDGQSTQVQRNVKI